MTGEKMKKSILMTMLCLFLVHAAQARLDEAEALYQKGEYAEMLTAFEPLAQQGDAEAQFWLGRMYAKGQGVERDAAQAMTWYRRAAEQGHTSAQFDLALQYMKVAGREKRKSEKANTYYRARTDQTVLENRAEAAKWFYQATQSGLARAQAQMGSHYRASGYGVIQNAPAAVFWYHKALGQGEKGVNDDLIWLYTSYMPEEMRDFDAAAGVIEDWLTLPNSRDGAGWNDRDSRINDFWYECLFQHCNLRNVSAPLAGLRDTAANARNETQRRNALGAVHIH